MSKALYTLLSKFKELFPAIYAEIDDYRAPQGDSIQVRLNDGQVLRFTYNGKDWKLENKR